LSFPTCLRFLLPPSGSFPTLRFISVHGWLVYYSRWLAYHDNIRLSRVKSQPANFKSQPRSDQGQTWGMAEKNISKVHRSDQRRMPQEQHLTSHPTHGDTESVKIHVLPRLSWRSYSYKLNPSRPKSSGKVCRSEYSQWCARNFSIHHAVVIRWRLGCCCRRHACGPSSTTRMMLGAPLYIADEKGHAAMTEQLIEARCNVDLQHENGWTALVAVCCHFVSAH
jgi:hypothetical protein